MMELIECDVQHAQVEIISIIIIQILFPKDNLFRLKRTPLNSYLYLCIKSSSKIKAKLK